HHNIWRDAQVSQKTFTYYHPKPTGLDVSGMMNGIKMVHSFCSVHELIILLE
ncbi:unnamed protein product, partial [Urochloa humidicola]